MTRRINIFTQTDWFTVFLYLILVIFGWMNIYSVNHVESTGFVFSLHNRPSMQLIWVGVSITLAVIIFLIDSRFYIFIAYPAYAFSLFLLLLVLIIGQEINGAKSWISLGPAKIQPSEFAKVAAVLVVAKFMSGYNVNSHSIKNILIAFGLILAPLALIMLQPDFGSTLVYIALILVLYREGLPGWILLLVVILAGVFLGYFLLSQLSLLIILTIGALIGFYFLNKTWKNVFVALGVLVGLSGFAYGLKSFGVLPSDAYLVYFGTLVTAVVILVIISIRKKIHGTFVIVLFLFAFIGFVYSIDFVFHNLMKPHHRERVEVMLGLKSDPWGYEYNVNQSKIAIGSGGFAGRGYLKGPQTKLKYVPEQSTDFIFCTVGEEWGFLGSVGLIAVFVTLLLRLIMIAERQRSRFSRIYGYGVVTVIFFHFAVNIAMTIALFPVIGIPLPFLSFGGSSLMAFTMMIFILLRLDSSRKAYLV